MADYARLAVLFKSRGIPAEVRTNGDIDTIVINTLDDERLVIAAGEKGWGYTLVSNDGLVEVGWVDEIAPDAPVEDVAAFLIEKIDFIFDEA